MARTGTVDRLSIGADGETTERPLELLEVILTDRSDRPERFMLRGEGVSLVGTLPPCARVGYRQQWRSLRGEHLSVESALEIPGEGERYSFVETSHGRIDVASGDLCVRRVAGPLRHEPTLQGDLRLVEGRSEVSKRIWTGTFSVKAVTVG